MLDRKDKLTDEFIHDSWMKMQVVLDNEMPVKKKRRFIFWLLLPVFVVTLLWSGYYLQSSSQLSEEVIDSLNHSAADLESSLGNHLIVDDILNNLVLGDTLNKIIQSNENQLFKEPKLVVNKNVDYSSIGDIKKSIEGENEATVFIELEQGTSKGAGIPSSEKVVKENTKTTLARQIPGFALLPNKTTFSVVGKSRTFSSKPPIDILVNPQSVAWVAFINSRIIESNSLNVEIGVSTYWLRSGGFSLFNSLGIGLDKHEGVVNSDNIDFQSISPNLSFSRELLDTYLREDSGYGNYILGNLGIAYQLNGRWSILAVVDYRYYFTGGSENQDLLAAEDNSSNPTEMNSFAQYSIQKNNDILFNLGAEYRYSQRLAFYTKLYYQINQSYTLTINDIQLEKLNLTKVNELRIGLNYSF